MPPPCKIFRRCSIPSITPNLLTTCGAAASSAVEHSAEWMQAEGIVALVENLTLSHLEGRYDDIEEVIDVLMRFAGAVAAGRR